MKFNLLPTTTVEQSNRLLEYGVKPETPTVIMKKTDM